MRGFGEKSCGQKIYNMITCADTELHSCQATRLLRDQTRLVFDTWFRRILFARLLLGGFSVLDRWIQQVSE